MIKIKNVLYKDLFKNEYKYVLYIINIIRIFEYQIKQKDMKKFIKDVLLFGNKDYRDISYFFLVVVLLFITSMIYVLL